MFSINKNKLFNHKKIKFFKKDTNRRLVLFIESQIEELFCGGSQEAQGAGLENRCALARESSNLSLRVRT